VQQSRAKLFCSHSVWHDRFTEIRLRGAASLLDGAGFPRPPGSEPGVHGSAPARDAPSGAVEKGDHSFDAPGVDRLLSAIEAEEALYLRIGFVVGPALVAEVTLPLAFD
jgi:hypothetical protein